MAHKFLSVRKFPFGVVTPDCVHCKLNVERTGF